MFTDDIVSLAFGKALIPFQVSVRWNGDEGKAQKQLTQKVKLTGVKEPSNYLTVVSPSDCTGIAQQCLKLKFTFSVSLFRTTFV